MFQTTNQPSVIGKLRMNQLAKPLWHPNIGSLRLQLAAKLPPSRGMSKSNERQTGSKCLGQRMGVGQPPKNITHPPPPRASYSPLKILNFPTPTPFLAILQNHSPPPPL